MELTAPDVRFRAGVAFGKVFLEKIEVASYQEWSVFGNCVNGAKRLQSIPPPTLGEAEPASRYRVVIGAVDSEYPNFLAYFNAWLQPKLKFDIRYLPPLEFLNARAETPRD